MYNKCASCGRLLENNEERRILLNEKGEIVTKCMDCFEKSLVRKTE